MHISLVWRFTVEILHGWCVGCEREAMIPSKGSLHQQLKVRIVVAKACRSVDTFVVLRSLWYAGP